MSANPPIEPKNFAETELNLVRKAVTTLYFLGNDIFQAVEKITQEEIDEDDKKILMKGVYNVASNGKINNDVVEYVDSQVNILSGSSSEGDGKKSQNNQEGNPEGNPEGNQEGNPEGNPEGNQEANNNNLEIVVNIKKNIKAILNKVQEYVGDNNEGKKIKEDEDAASELNLTIKVLNEQLQKYPSLNLKNILDNAINAVDTDEKNLINDEHTAEYDPTLASQFVEIEIAKLQSTSDDPQIEEERVDTEFTTKDVENILTAAKKNIESEGDGPAKKYNIKDKANYDNSKKEDLDPVLYALKTKLTENPDLNLEKLLTDAIAKVIGEYELPSDKSSASEVAVGLINEDADDIESAELTIDDNDESKSKKATVETVTELLNNAKKYVADNKNKEEDGKIKSSADDGELQKVIEAIQKKITSDNNIDINLLLQNAIGAIPKDLDSDKSAADVAVELINDYYDLGELDDSDLDEGDDIEGEQPAVTVETVTELLKKIKKYAIVETNQQDKQIKEINDDKDSNAVIAAVNEKIKDKSDIDLDLDLHILFDNAIDATQKDVYEIPKNNTQTNGYIAAELIQKSSFELTLGGKPNKYVYGGKTVRAYPKNISFSKKNPSKKKHNKKTIRKLQKLMNKRK